MVMEESSGRLPLAVMRAAAELVCAIGKSEIENTGLRGDCNGFVEIISRASCVCFAQQARMHEHKKVVSPTSYALGKKLSRMGSF